MKCINQMTNLKYFNEILKFKFVNKNKNKLKTVTFYKLEFMAILYKIV